MSSLFIPTIIIGANEKTQDSYSGVKFVRNLHLNCYKVNISLVQK